jgi:hypothetical protein
MQKRVRHDDVERGILSGQGLVDVLTLQSQSLSESCTPGFQGVQLVPGYIDGHDVRTEVQKSGCRRSVAGAQIQHERFPRVLSRCAEYVRDQPVVSPPELRVLEMRRPVEIILRPGMVESGSVQIGRPSIHAVVCGSLREKTRHVRSGTPFLSDEDQRAAMTIGIAAFAPAESPVKNRIETAEMRRDRARVELYRVPSVSGRLSEIFFIGEILPEQKESSRPYDPDRALKTEVDIPDVIEAMYWNPRDTDDPAHTWLRECIATASATLATPG